MQCSVEGCTGPQRSKTLCEKHYYRQYRHGDVNKRLRRANGEGGYTPQGYFRVMEDDRRVREHILVAEKALGKPLPKGAVVHHWNEDKSDNRPINLAIFPDQGYHNLIHGRMKAYEATGDANSKPCRFCHKYDQDINLMKNGTSHYHKACNAEYQRKYRAERRALTKGV